MKTKDKYYIFNKPFQMMSQFSREGEKSTLADAGFEDRDIYPVGRLDHDSEGLLILSNDNYLIHKLTSHSVEHSRTYLVQVDGEINDEAVNNLRNGLEINIDSKLYRTKNCEVKIVPPPENLWQRNPPVRFRANIPTSWIEITLKEGKNRQVRKMTAKAGFPTLRLIRFSIEDIKLDGIQPGEYIKMGKEVIYQKLGIGF